MEFFIVAKQKRGFVLLAAISRAAAISVSSALKVMFFMLKLAREYSAHDYSADNVFSLAFRRLSAGNPSASATAPAPQRLSTRTARR